MKKFLLFMLLSSLVLANSAETILEMRANVLPLNFLIVEVDDIDFGDVNKGNVIQENSAVRVYGRKDLDVRIDIESETSLVNKLDNLNSIKASFLNHSEVTGRTYKLNQNIDGEEGQVSVPINYELSVPASVKSGEYIGSTVVRVTIDS